MNINKQVLTAVFVGLLCVLLAPNLVYGVRGGHDINFHMTLFLSYRDAVELGTLYPRWLPDQLHGLGSPALMIYPPLASAFFVLIDFLTFHALAPQRVLGLGALLLSIASAVTFYLWARKYVNARLALIVALFYAIAPYHLNLDLYERGAMAEYTTFVWIPLVFLGIRTTILAGNAQGAALLATSVGALFLTHLLTAMLIAPLALAYALICLRMELPAGLRISRFALLVLTTVLGAALAAFYYLPALSLLAEANSGALYREVAATNIFSVLQTLFRDTSATNIRSALGALSPKDRFKLKLLLLACVYFVLFLYLLAETWSNWRKAGSLRPATALALMWIVSGILCFALMSGLFPFIFYPPSPYAQIQFGWRLLVVMEFSLVSLFVCNVAGTQHAGSRARLLKAGVVVALILSAAQCMNTEARFRNMDISAQPVQNTSEVKWRLGTIEYFPAGTKYTQQVDNAIKPFEQYAHASRPAFIASDKGKVVDATRAGTRFTVHSIASEPTSIMIQQFYFPGWKALDEQGNEIVVFPDKASRLASYMVPAGEHTIVMERFPTKQEHWGNIISLIALLLFVLHLGFLGKRHQTNQVTRPYAQ